VRTVSWALGLALLVWLTCGGPAVYQEVLLSAHLLQHVALATSVPLLLAGAAPFRLLAVARRRDVRSDGRPVIPMAPAAALALAALLALYGTGLLRWSVTDALGGEWALVQCLLAGLLLAGAVRSGSRRSATRVVVAVLVAEGVLAAVLGGGGGLLLPDWYGAMGWGVDARIDQRTGAVAAGVLALLSTAGLLAVRRPVEDGDRARDAAPVVLRDEVQA
jgi:cytochrome c oxidase assembly factor CtaG